MSSKINWIDADEYHALVELIKSGKLSPLVDVIASRLEQSKGLHSASLDAMKSLDSWDGGLDYYIRKLPNSSRIKRNAGRPKAEDSDQLYKFKRNLLGLSIGKICYEAVEAGEAFLPSKAELTRRILLDDYVSTISGFKELGSTRRNELIDEAYSLIYGKKYPAEKPLN